MYILDSPYLNACANVLLRKCITIITVGCSEMQSIEDKCKFKTVHSA